MPISSHKPRGAPEHLVEQDAAVHAAQEHQVADLRHVDAGREQVDGDGDVGVALVLVAPDELERLVGRAGDLEDRVVLDAAILVAERLLEQIDDQIRMGVVGAEDQGLLSGPAGRARLARYSQTTRLKDSVMTLRLKSSTSMWISSGVVKRSIWCCCAL